MFSKLTRWFESIFSNKKIKTEVPPISFHAITVVETPPQNSDIEDRKFYLVGKQQKFKWVMFKCPCGCGYIITLSVQSIHNPHWQLSTSNSRPTLYPSVWQKTGCNSHFWLEDGRIYWCENTGDPYGFSNSHKG